MHPGSKTQTSTKVRHTLVLPTNSQFNRHVPAMKNCGHHNFQIPNYSKTTKTTFATSPNLPNFSFQKTNSSNTSNIVCKKCSRVQNAASNNFRSGSFLGTRTLPDSQPIYTRNNWNTNIKYFPNAPPAQLQKPLVDMAKYAQANNGVIPSKHPSATNRTNVNTGPAIPKSNTQEQPKVNPVVNKNAVHGDNSEKINSTPATVKAENVNKNIKNMPPEGRNVIAQSPTPPQKRKEVTSPKTNSAPKPAPPAAEKKDIVEIYKNVKKRTASTENMNFQQVTQELANIIKNFQRQIQEVPLSRQKMEEVPSAMIQPKIKEYFKNTTPETLSMNLPRSSAENNKAPATKPQPAANKTQNEIPKNELYTHNKVAQRASLRSFSKASITHKTSSIRRFRSSTHHALSIKSSNSSRAGITKRASSINVDPLKQLKEEVQKAIRERKTFTVRGRFLPIRKALLARGWIEKFHISYKDHVNDEMKRYQSYSISELLPLLRREDLTNTCKNLIKSKLLGGYQVDFYWGTNDESFKENPDKIKFTTINKMKREIFSYTNKQGLCEASKFSYWYQKSNVSKLNHPRCYSLGKNGDLKGFVEDFNITAAMSLLKWVVKISVTKECKLLSPTGKIPLETFDFALNECCKFIKKGHHEDIDMQIPDATDHEWEQFLDYFYKLVHYNNHFKCEKTETEASLVRKSNYILNNLKGFYPFVDMDGMMNIWILKPTASSRGRGIHMCRTMQYILKIIKQNTNTRYIIQKYIERPLLIYNTKFDIRQWFLISNCSPLTIWMYKECYLRFSSQTYNLRKLHESIHLTNNSVQCKYKNTSVDSALPSYNMWDSNDFQKYLTNIGYPQAFKRIVYPGMQQCITAAVLMHQDKMVVRKNCFELYGADFILTEDFQPWLLEINSNPALYGSTPVTARMCPKVLEDVIKVVIDFAHNNKSKTGEFEMIYKEQLSKLPATLTLEVKGLPLQNDYFFNGGEQDLNKSVKGSENPAKSLIAGQHEPLKAFGEEIKKTLKNLLEIIQNEKQKRGLKQQQNLKSVVPVAK